MPRTPPTCLSWTKKHLVPSCWHSKMPITLVSQGTDPFVLHTWAFQAHAHTNTHLYEACECVNLSGDSVCCVCCVSVCVCVCGVCLSICLSVCLTVCLCAFDFLFFREVVQVCESSEEKSAWITALSELQVLTKVPPPRLNPHP